MVRLKKRYHSLGFKNITMLHTRDPQTANTEAFVKPISCARGVWFTGGRQWRLADAYLNTLVQEELFGLLSRGGVIAIRGIGGYHLAVDATNAAAVARLRKRKRRSNKAFALMAPSAEAVARYCRVGEAERRLLESRERPIVLLERREECGLPAEVAPGVAELGFMLPYSPLHALLFFPLAGGKSAALSVLVMTSGNLSEEPVIRDRGEAEEKLAGIADAYLHHDRDIFMRIDDSVVRVLDEQTVFIRRARGYVPSAVPLARKGPMVLACGADVKNTFCLTTTDAAVVSQHIGDMESYETLRFFAETLKNLSSVYRVEPIALGHDLHPRYYSTRWALEQEGIDKVGIQHHHAHIASVAAEHGLDEPLAGIALDGSGYGGDGTVWGGEVLVLREGSFERRGCFRQIPMPGGEAAARNPWQMLLSWLRAACGAEALSVAEELGLAQRRGHDEVENLFRILDNRTLSPLTSGAGRLFESVASLLGICDVNTYEGEAAMALEAIAAGGAGQPYAFVCEEGPLTKIDFSPTVAAIIKDLRQKADRRLIASRFHRTVAEAVVTTASGICRAEGLATVALSGGVFQNRMLLKAVIAGLRSRGLRPYINTVVPANDAGISLGQAWIVRKHLEQ
jgi:hydrogenase maturation protein HypF